MSISQQIAGKLPGASQNVEDVSGASMHFFTRVVDAIDYIVRIYMRVQRYFSPLRIGRTFFGAEIVCDLRDFIQRRIYFFSIYEPNLTHFIIKNTRPGSTFVDLGANIGYISLLASKMVGPDGRVISIEASPSTHSLLAENLRRNHCDNTDALNVAATETFTVVEIVNTEEGNIGANAIGRHTPGGKGTTVEGKPIVAILGDRAAQVSFIKIDIEGSEAPVLQDLLDNVDKFSPDLLIVAEISPSSAAYVERFRDAGFQVSVLPNNYRIGYFLVRSYLARSGEQDFTVTFPVSSYDPAHTDYVFDRRGSRAGVASS